MFKQWLRLLVPAFAASSRENNTLFDYSDYWLKSEIIEDVTTLLRWSIISRLSRGSRF